jgi:hypothetical protein
MVLEVLMMILRRLRWWGKTQGQTTMLRKAARRLPRRVFGGRDR